MVEYTETCNHILIRSVMSSLKEFIKYFMLDHCVSLTEAYSEPCQTSNMERFGKIVNG